VIPSTIPNKMTAIQSGIAPETKKPEGRQAVNGRSTG
jgi:hypothetical protein